MRLTNSEIRELIY